MQSDSKTSNYAAPNRKLWVYGLIVTAILATLLYFGLQNQKDRSINHDYYRVLYEASNTFNENLQKLDSMHQYKESVSSIRSLLPSYTEKHKCSGKSDSENESNSEDNENKTDTKLAVASYQYEVIGTSLFVSSSNCALTLAQLEISDILPQPKKGFSQYLFANENEVLAMVGSERTISIVELDSINKQIQKKNKQFQFNFTDNKSSRSDSAIAPLPTFSNHVDMKISYGEFRVFIFPFSLKTPLHQNVDGNNASDEKLALDRLYLVGLLPQSKLSSRSGGDWNISLLIVSLSSLFFMWCMLRLYLLPKNQSISKSFRALVGASSYLFFIVLIALVLAYFQKTVLQTKKDNIALTYAQSIEAELADDIDDVFSELKTYRSFYSQLYAAIQSYKFVPQNKQKDSEQTNNETSEEVDPEKIKLFNYAVQSALLSINPEPCRKNKPNEVEDKVPSRAGTSKRTYEITYECMEQNQASSTEKVMTAKSNEKFLGIALDNDAIKTIIAASNSSVGGKPTLDFYASNQFVNLEKDESLETSIKPTFDRTKPNKVLSVFALDREGNSVLPSINFQEGNSLPTTFNLSHRDYYKKVRDQKGWNLNIEGENGKKTFNNVYMQRLLNVNNGTRGTTISMPIVEPSMSPKSTKALDFIIGADVILPSVSLGRSPPYDFVYMVVDRTSGEVLFHNDSNRSLVENLYFSGDTSSALSQWLQAGLDNHDALSTRLIEGVYHGQSGRFALSKTIVDKWSVVVFYPDASLQSFMTNQFLYIATTFACIIALLVLLIFAIRQVFWTSTLKQRLKLPSKLSIRLIMLVSSILFGAGYCLYIVGYNLEFLIFDNTSIHYSMIIPATGLAVITFFLYLACFNHLCYPLNISDKTLSNMARSRARNATRYLLAAALMAVFGHFLYLQKTADAPYKSLDFHYQQIACNLLNYERAELISMGLSRYPNSITSTKISPLDLLPIDDEWREQLKNISPKLNGNIQNNCSKHSSQVHPDDFPSLDSVFGSKYLWQWINIYILNKELNTSSKLPLKSETNLDQKEKELSSNEKQNTGTSEVASKLLNQTLLFSFLLTLIAIYWFRFNTKTVWNKLYCPERFLQHIENLTKSLGQKSYTARAKNLTIECETVKLNGIGLALLLRTMSMGKTQHAKDLLNGFDELFNLSPCLQTLSAEKCFLPNVKLNILKSETNDKLSIELWDIETCLENSVNRKRLLELIMELKSLTLSNQVNNFTIFTGFHSLQRVKIKDPLALDESMQLDNTEYLSWAECLMDFVVNVPPSFMRDIDAEFLRDEIAHFPELEFILENIPQVHHTNNWGGVLKQDHDVYMESRWATINYILFNADALYRFKWESCSSAEKLALVNLAKKQHLNPANTQMIEHLALVGLITVRDGQLCIINRSFAHFVLHAETTETLNQLISEAEAGIWKNYKIPLGVLIILIIGGIALTSGESIYIIAASMAGILGTIASVTNSANLLRGSSS